MAKYNVFARFVKARNERRRAAPYVGPKKGNPARLNEWWRKHRKSLPVPWQEAMTVGPVYVNKNDRRLLMAYLKEVPGQHIYRKLLDAGHSMPPQMWDNIDNENRESAIWQVNFGEKNKVPVASASNANLRAFLKLNEVMTEQNNQMRAFYRYIMDPGTNFHPVRAAPPKPVKQNTPNMKRAMDALWNDNGPEQVKKKRAA